MENIKNVVKPVELSKVNSTAQLGSELGRILGFNGCKYYVIYRKVNPDTHRKRTFGRWFRSVERATQYRDKLAKEPDVYLDLRIERHF